MADSLSSGRGRKLPPLSPKSVPSDQGSVPSDTPRKRKKKKPATYDETERTPRTASARKVKDPTRTDESVENDVPVKKKKKPVGTSRETLMSDAEILSDRTDQSRKKKKKKKVTEETATQDVEYSGDLGLAGELGDLHEDIVIVTEPEEMGKGQWNNAPAMRSEPMGKIFIEKETGFKTTDKSKLARKRAEQQRRVEAIPVAPPDYNTMQVAFGTHRVFKTFTLFLQGLFAGIALWHIVAVWTLSNNGWPVFLEYYYNLALPVSCMYYFLFGIVTVAVFDRYDIGRPTRRLFARCCTMQSGMIACLIYFTGLLFTLGITNIDDKIALYKRNETFWPDNEDTDSELSKWRILNLMRGLMAILGWFVIALRPNTDRLKKNLQEDDLFFEEIGAQIDGLVGDELKHNGV